MVFLYVYFLSLSHTLCIKLEDFHSFLLYILPPCVNLVLSRLWGAYYHSNAIATITKKIISWGLLQFKG